jgi:DNA-binding IclR family transcriptional regulator
MTLITSNTVSGAASTSPKVPKDPSGSQTLLRGLDVIDAVVDGPITLSELAAKLDLNRSTAHRLASALITRRYLTLVPRLGYQLGPKLLALGHQAQQQTDLVQVSRQHLETLASISEDTVHLAVLETDRALYLAKISGRRRVDISSRVGERQLLTPTGIGKALLLDDGPDRWLSLFREDQAGGAPPADLTAWLERMRHYAASGYAFDLEENEDLIRCVAAPLRDASGSIVGAISVSSAAQYLSDDRMEVLADDVTAASRMISLDLGWTGSLEREDDFSTPA